MKRILASVLVLSVMSVGLVGCGDKTKVEKKDSVKTPTGSQTTTTTTETTKTGDKK
jgi:predicted small lipoprotein YifL